MSFLLFLLVIALLLVLSILSFGISLIRGILSIFFPALRRRTSAYSQHSQAYRGQDTTASAGKKSKIFDKTEGDYADYEEVK